MNPLQESPGDGTPDIAGLWIKAARQFYSISAGKKKDMARYQKFVSAYRGLARFLPLSQKTKLLDVGCGCGELAGALAGQVGTYHGVDISAESLDVARARNPDCIFSECDAVSGLPAGPFDIVTAISSVEFCYDKRKLLNEIFSALEPGGLFYLEVRNGSFPLVRIPQRLRLLLEDAGILARYPAPGFRDLLHGEWQDLIRGAGFVIQKEARSCRPLCYGGLVIRLKGLLLGIMNTLLPKRMNYMTGFVCCKDVGRV